MIILLCSTAGFLFKISKDVSMQMYILARSLVKSPANFSTDFYNNKYTVSKSRMYPETGGSHICIQ